MLQEEKKTGELKDEKKERGEKKEEEAKSKRLNLYMRSNSGGGCAR